MKINSKIYKLIHNRTIYSYQKWHFINIHIFSGPEKFVIRRCFHPKGYQIHQNSPSYIPCIECDKQTYSEYGFCNSHARKHRKREQYHRKKQAKLTLVETVVENLEVNKIDITCH